MKNAINLVLAVLLVSCGAPANAYQVFQGPPPSKFSETFVPTTPGGSVVSSSNGLPITISDSAAVDATGRLRVSNTFGVFEDKRTYNTGTGLVWNESVSGVGAAVTFLPNESSVLMTIGTASGSKIIRESRYLAYVPGKSALIKITTVLGAGVANVTKRVGYFNDANGLFLQQAGSVLSIVRRTSTSGTVVDNVTPQTSWNLDRLDGSCTLAPVSRCEGSANPSGLTLDITKSQLLVIDFLWQGVGRARYGFSINGKIVYFHEGLHSNVLDTVYIGTPSLPVRYEIQNTATSAGATLKQICVAVESEGGYTPPGVEFSASNGIAPRAITTVIPVLAIRLINTFQGLPNRKTVRIIHLGGRATTNDAFCTLEHMHGVTATAGGTWTQVEADSAVEVNTGLTSITATDSHTVDTNFLVSGQGSFASTFGQNLDFISGHSTIFQNIGSTQSTVLALYCTSFAGTSNVSMEMNWQEYD